MFRTVRRVAGRQYRHPHTHWGDRLGRACAVLTGTMRLASVECGEICQSRADLQAKGSESNSEPSRLHSSLEHLKPCLGVHVLVGSCCIDSMNFVIFIHSLSRLCDAGPYTSFFSVYNIKKQTKKHPISVLWNNLGNLNRWTWWFGPCVGKHLPHWHVIDRWQ